MNKRKQAPQWLLTTSITLFIAAVTQSGNALRDYQKPDGHYPFFMTIFISLLCLGCLTLGLYLGARMNTDKSMQDQNPPNEKA